MLLLLVLLVLQRRRRRRRAPPPPALPASPPSASTRRHPDRHAARAVQVVNDRVPVAHVALLLPVDDLRPRDALGAAAAHDSLAVAELVVHDEGGAGPAVPVALEPGAAVAVGGVAAGVGGGVEVAFCFWWGDFFGGVEVEVSFFCFRVLFDESECFLRVIINCFRLLAAGSRFGHGERGQYEGKVGARHGEKTRWPRVEREIFFLPLRAQRCFLSFSSIISSAFFRSLTGRARTAGTSAGEHGRHKKLFVSE